MAYAQDNMRLTVTNHNNISFYLTYFVTSYGDWHEINDLNKSSALLTENSVILIGPEQSTQLFLTHTDGEGIGGFAIIASGADEQNCSLSIDANNSPLGFDLSRNGTCIFNNQNYYLEGDFGNHTITESDFSVDIEDHNE